MEWTEFLESVAIKYKLTPEQRETLIVRLNRGNDDKNNIQISTALDISEVQYLERSRVLMRGDRALNSNSRLKA
ncbi:MAG: hypothetical protein SW833_24295 [Cyanobacteriota bacterium]|nr:hypothetical protein [Cyanobacteriota bacterium]